MITAKPVRVLRRKMSSSALEQAKRKARKISKEIGVCEGSSNVFADLGLEGAEELQVKSGLTRQIFNRIKELKLTQVKAASILAVSQPDVSKLMHCRYTGFSVSVPSSPWYRSIKKYALASNYAVATHRRGSRDASALSVRHRRAKRADLLCAASL